MTLREFKKESVLRLRTRFGEKESATLVDILLEWVTGKARAEIFADYDRRCLDPDEVLKLNSAVAGLLQDRPVQYITGRVWFYDLLLKVDERVLIPRPETEELVKWILDENASRRGPRILDVGTGSGCIALSLAKYLRNAEVMALDFSGRALEVAQDNARQVGAAVEFIRADFLDRETWSRLPGFDIIVSNPPYVRHSEKSLMRSNVLGHEPPEALFVPNEEPLLYYIALADFARTHLAGGGRLYCEINEAFGQETRALMLAAGFADVVLKQDLHGKDRMIRAGD